jgi:hypothetical protein
MALTSILFPLSFKMRQSNKKMRQKRQNKITDGSFFVAL